MAPAKKKSKKPAKAKASSAKPKAKPAPKAAPKSQAKPAPKAASQSSSKSKTKSAAKSGGPLSLKPIRSRVILQREEGEERTAGGLYVPDTAKEKPAYGRVLAVGSGAIDKKGRLRPMTLKAGDRVVYNRWSGSQVQLDGRDLLVIEEKEIVGVFDD